MRLRPIVPLLWRVVDAALEQPNPTKALQDALSMVLAKAGSSRVINDQMKREVGHAT